MSDNSIGPVSVTNTVAMVGMGLVALAAIGGVWYVASVLGKVKDKAGEAADYLREDGLDVTSNKNLPTVLLNGTAKTLGLIDETNTVSGQANSIGGAFASTALGQALFEFGEWGESTFGKAW